MKKYCAICADAEAEISVSEGIVCQDCFVSLATDAMEFARQNTKRGTVYHEVYAQICQNPMPYMELLMQDAIQDTIKKERSYDRKKEGSIGSTKERNG